MPRKTQFTEQEIVAAAVDLVRESGWGGLSVKAVGARIGSSTMPIYSHFDNLEKLKDAVVGEGWKKLMHYEGLKFTGDVWVDQSIGYIAFAVDETNLFHSMFDGRNIELQKQLGLKNWVYLTEMLEDYVGFQDVPLEQKFLIRYSRSVFTHGMAVSVTARLWDALLSIDGMVEKLVTAGSHAILEGIKSNYDTSDDAFAFIDKEVKELMRKFKAKIPQEEERPDT